MTLFLQALHKLLWFFVFYILLEIDIWFILILAVLFFVPKVAKLILFFSNSCFHYPCFALICRQSSSHNCFVHPRIHYQFNFARQDKISWSNTVISKWAGLVYDPISALKSSFWFSVTLSTGSLVVSLPMTGVTAHTLSAVTDWILLLCFL